MDYLWKYLNVSSNLVANEEFGGGGDDDDELGLEEIVAV